MVYVFGAGNLGQRLGPDIVRSGASVRVYDNDHASQENLGAQAGPLGARKVDIVVDACNAIEPGRAMGFCLDVLHVGVAELAEADLWIDCTDDPALAVPLTILSNGLGKPLLRVALDGSGQLELGRVLCSHGGAGYSCQLCAYDLAQVLRYTPRTPCPGQGHYRAPTFAGGAIGMMMAGAALLQAQRLVSGNNTELVRDRELLLDMSHLCLEPLERRRSDQCLSGHIRWDLTRVSRSLTETTFLDLFDDATRGLKRNDITLEPYAHPLCTEVACECGESRTCVGTCWATPPSCAQCQRTMAWVVERQRDRVTLRDVHELGIQTTPLSELGMPSRGLMVVARASGKPPLRLVLN